MNPIEKHILGIHYISHEATCGIGTLRKNSPSDLIFLKKGHLLLSHTKFSEGILTQIETALAVLNNGILDLSGLIVATGPGFFTGQRLSIAIAQTMSLCDKLPAVGVHTFDLTAEAAYQAFHQQEVIVLLDAGKDGIFFAHGYRSHSYAIWEYLTPPKWLSIAQAEKKLKSLKYSTNSILFAGNGFQAHPSLKENLDKNQIFSSIESSFLDFIRLGFAQFEKKNWTSSYKNIFPLYIDKENRWQKQTPSFPPWSLSDI